MRYSQKELKGMDKPELIKLVFRMQEKLKERESLNDFLEKGSRGLIEQVKQLEEKLNKEVELPGLSLTVYEQMMKNPSKKFVESEAIRFDMLNVLINKVGERFNVANMTNLLSSKYSDHSNLYRTVWTVAKDKDKDKMKLPGYKYHYDENGHAHEFWLEYEKKATKPQPEPKPVYCAGCGKKVVPGRPGVMLSKVVVVEGTKYNGHDVVLPQHGKIARFVHRSLEGRFIRMEMVPKELQERAKLEDQAELTV